MFNITGHLCLMSFDFPILNSVHFEYVLLICVFNDSVFDATKGILAGFGWTRLSA